MHHIRNKLAITLLFVLSARAQQTTDTDPAALASRALALQQSGDYAAAAEAYGQLLRVQPDEVATHVNLGVMLVHLNRFDEAIAEYQAAEKLLPGDPRIALNMALAYQKSGRIRDAATRLAALHQADPGNRQVTMLLADNHLHLGENEDVIDLLQPLSSAHDPDLGISYMLGLALLRTGRIDEGQVLLDRILSAGDTAEAHYLMGTRMFESQDYPAAARELAAALKINPNLPQGQSLYGRALLNTGDPESARKAFQAELSANPYDFEANAGLGEILVAQGKFAAALPLLQRAIDSRSEVPGPRLALARALVGTRRFKEALPEALAAVKASPRSSEVHKTLAAAEDGLGRTADANHERATAKLLRREAEPAPHVGDLAPDFALPDAISSQPTRLSQFRGRRPVVLVLGSYSCPNLRSAAATLQDAYRNYHERVAFLLVYIREAHPETAWQSTRNEREGVETREAASLEERSRSASACARNLHLPFTALVDSMDNATEAAYHAWPSRAFIIDEAGRIVYSTRLTQLDFQPEEFQKALRLVLSRSIAR